MSRMNSDVAGQWQERGRFGIGRQAWHEAEAALGLVGRQAAQRRVAVMDVVEGLEGPRAGGQVRQIGEALGAEELAVEGVVEVLDHRVAPWLAEGDEDRRHAERQAHAQESRQVASAARQPGLVVELEPRRQPEPAPDRQQAAAQLGVGLGDDDLAAHRVATEVDHVEHVEADRPGQVAGPDQVGLVAGVGRQRRRVRVGRALGW